MKKHKLIIILFIIIVFLFDFIGSKGEVVENLDVPVAFGYDLEKKDENKFFSVPFALYIFESPGNVTSTVITGKAKTIGDTREERHLKCNKEFLLGLERIYVISESWADYSIKNIIDILLSTPQINDRAMTVICSGKTEDILKHKVKGYANSGEYIEGMLKNAKQFNFFSQHFSMMDLIVRVDTEGRNSVLPYIELKDNNIEMTGLAIFKKDKMVGKTDMKSGKIINLLKENNVHGMLTIEKNPQEYINFYATSKRKVKCLKKDGKYDFVINLDLNGSIVSNELYENLNKDPQDLKDFQKDMEQSVEKICKDTINKIKSEYKVDILDLGRVAAATYGKGTGVDWNKIVCDSNIDVNVKITVDTEGRGDY